MRRKLIIGLIAAAAAVIGWRVFDNPRKFDGVADWISDGEAPSLDFGGDGGEAEPAAEDLIKDLEGKADALDAEIRELGDDLESSEPAIDGETE